MTSARSCLGIENRISFIAPMGFYLKTDKQVYCPRGTDVRNREVTPVLGKSLLKKRFERMSAPD